LVDVEKYNYTQVTAAGSTDHVMNDLRPMVAQFSHRLEYVHLLTVLELLPNAADGGVKSALQNAVAITDNSTVVVSIENRHNRITV